MDPSSFSVCTGLHVFKVNLQTVITCATSSCMFLIDFDSGDLIYLIDFNEINLDNSKKDVLACLLPQTVEFCLVDGKQVNAALLSLFQNEINIVKCADIFSKNEYQLSQHPSNLEDALTVFPK